MDTGGGSCAQRRKCAKGKIGGCWLSPAINFLLASWRLCAQPSADTASNRTSQRPAQGNETPQLPACGSPQSLNNRTSLPKGRTQTVDNFLRLRKINLNHTTHAKSFRLTETSGGSWESTTAEQVRLPRRKNSPVKALVEVARTVFVYRGRAKARHKAQGVLSLGPSKEPRESTPWALRAIGAVSRRGDNHFGLRVLPGECLSR